MDEDALKRAWESSQRSTKEDWAEWMRQFAVELLRESPSPALRATHTLAQVLPHGASPAQLHPPLLFHHLFQATSITWSWPR